MSTTVIAFVALACIAMVTLVVFLFLSGVHRNTSDSTSTNEAQVPMSDLARYLSFIQGELARLKEYWEGLPNTVDPDRFRTPLEYQSMVTECVRMTNDEFFNGRGVTSIDVRIKAVSQRYQHDGNFFKMHVVNGVIAYYSSTVAVLDRLTAATSS